MTRLMATTIFLTFLGYGTALACPGSTAKASLRSTSMDAATASGLTVSISVDGIFRSRVRLPDEATGSCTTSLYSRLLREDSTTGRPKHLRTKTKVGKLVQFRANRMPSVRRSGDDAPSLSFFAITTCNDVGFAADSDTVATYLDCGDPSRSAVTPAQFVKLLRARLR